MSDSPVAGVDGDAPVVTTRELAERFGGDCRPLFVAVYRRLERTGGLGTNAFEVRDPTAAERRAIAALLGTTVTAAGPLRVRPAAITAALAASRYATDLLQRAPAREVVHQHPVAVEQRPPAAEIRHHMRVPDLVEHCRGHCRNPPEP